MTSDSDKEKLEIRLECLKLANVSRELPEIMARADKFFEWVTQGSMFNQAEKETAPETVTQISKGYKKKADKPSIESML